MLATGWVPSGVLAGAIRCRASRVQFASGPAIALVRVSMVSIWRSSVDLAGGVDARTGATGVAGPMPRREVRGAKSRTSGRGYMADTM